MADNSSQIELRQSESSSTWLNETITGSHRFTVEGYSYDKRRMERQMSSKYISSEAFIVGGYECFIKYSPGGLKIGFVTFLFRIGSEHTIMSGLESTKVQFTILKQSEDPSSEIDDEDPSSEIGNIDQKSYFVTDDNTCKMDVYGYFFETNYVKNDSFTMICTVTVVKESRLVSAKLKPVVVPPPSNLDVQFTHLLESGKGADVIFEVNGERFKAHKCILAARSPVFSAQFFGAMNEKGDKSVKLDDVEPEVFRVLLHFIYSDSVGELKGGTEYGEKHDEVAMYQHLLVVADRYEVERLKIICENELSQNIDVVNLATTLTLAEQHNCSRLKSSCFEFVSSLEILASVMKTDGFEHLIKSCPLVLNELVENMGNLNVK